MKRKLMGLLLLALIGGFVFFVSGCQTKTSATTETTTTSTGDYYDSANFVQGSEAVSETKLVTYDGPSLLTTSSICSITVNNHPLFVYETRVNNARSFSYEYSTDVTPLVIFDFEGTVHVVVTINDQTEITKATVSPLVYGITPTISGNTISFDLNYNGNYVLQYNDDSNTAIQIFANPLEENPITEEDAASDDSIIYIGPGVYKADAIPAQSNTTIYLAGGAYVYGQIRAEGVTNLTIRGRGIISGSIYERRTEAEYTLPVEIRKSSNITIQDICFLDPAGWTITIYKCSDVNINNIKIITARANGDGISIQSSSNVNVNGGYVRTWDDSLVVKNTDRGTTDNVTFNGVIVWTDLAQSMEVGYETYGATMDHITFENITVVHNFHKPLCSIHNSDDAVITNVKYQNITLEDGEMLGDNRTDGENDFLFDLTVAFSVDWTKSEGERGSIDGVTFENIKIYRLADSIISRINGESDNSDIKNVAFDGIEIAGRQAANTTDLKLVTNQYVSDVTVEKMDKVTGAIITLPYRNEVASSTVDYTEMPNITQSGLLVPSFATSSSEPSYIGVKANATFNVSATHSAGNKTSTPADDGSGEFTMEGYNKEAVVDNDRDTLWSSKEFTGIDNEFACLTIDFGGALKTVGVIRILGQADNQFYYTYTIQVWGRKLKSDGTINDNYTRLVSSKDYEMSPGSGNYIDINITSQSYAGIQLRMYRGDSVSSPNYYQISEIEFYPPSLTFNKAIVFSTPNADVYNIEKAVDGDSTGTSYYESASLPAEIVIDMGDVYSISCVVLTLPPSLIWDARTQNIAILFSDSNDAYSDGTVFTQYLREDMLFDPALGNLVLLNISGVNARYIKIVIYSNDASGGYGGQLSEISVYGE